MNLLFDIDDTLFPSSEFSALARKNAINAMIGMGLEIDYAQLNDRLTAIISEKGSNYPKHFDDLCASFDVKRPGRFIAAAVAAYHDTKASIAPYPKAPLTLFKLKENHHLFVATNGSSVKQWDKLIRLGLAFYFEKVFVSEDIGRKKDAEFYNIIVGNLKCSPSECMMVGDREDSDIAPAKEAGLMTVRVLKGKHADEPSTADHTISDIGELLQIMKNL